MEIQYIKKVDGLESDVNQLKIDMAIAQSDIKNVKEDIGTIEDDTHWLRRTMTGVLIGVAEINDLWQIIFPITVVLS